MRCWLIVVLAIGCRDERISRLEHIRDQVCACPTAECADAALKQVPQDHVESTPRSQHIAREMLDCLSKLYEAGRPSTDPDAEAPEQTTTRRGSSDPASARTP
jgi:hypothetical protein